MKHTKIDTLLDSGSQAILIFEKVVKPSGLKTKKHRRPHTLNGVSKNHKLSVSKQCILQFVVTSQYMDKVTCDVVPLDACGMVLGSPYC